MSFLSRRCILLFKSNLLYGKNDCEAVKYFNKFLAFPTENKKKIAINYKDQKQYIEASLEMSQFFCDFYTNPVPFQPKVLNNISTAERNEILPVISPDNEHIYYTIEYDQNNKR